MEAWASASSSSSGGEPNPSLEGRLERGLLLGGWGSWEGFSRSMSEAGLLFIVGVVVMVEEVTLELSGDWMTNRSRVRFVVGGLLQDERIY